MIREKSLKFFWIFYIFNLLIGNLTTQLFLLSFDQISYKIIGSLCISVFLYPMSYYFIKLYKKTAFFISQISICLAGAIIFGLMASVFIFTLFGIIDNGFSSDIWIIFKLVLLGNFFLMWVWVIFGCIEFIFLKLTQKYLAS